MEIKFFQAAKYITNFTFQSFSIIINSTRFRYALNYSSKVKITLWRLITKFFLIYNSVLPHKFRINFTQVKNIPMIFKRLGLTRQVLWPKLYYISPNWEPLKWFWMVEWAQAPTSGWPKQAASTVNLSCSISCRTRNKVQLGDEVEYYPPKCTVEARFCECKVEIILDTQNNQEY